MADFGIGEIIMANLYALGTAAAYGASSVTASGVAAAATVAGAGVSGYSAIQAGANAKTQANMTADAQKKTAESVENAAAVSASNEKLKAKRIEAAQVNAAGAGGVSPSTGTPLTIESQNNAQRTAWGYDTQEDINENKDYETAGYLKGAGSLLGGVSNASFGYARS
jgi:uncharacterized protein HemX